jgi:DNA-binding protein WhiA
VSFSNDVKNEVSRIEDEDRCCELAELFGLLKISGSVSLQGKKVGINFITENAALARRTLRLLKDNFNVQTEVVITRSRRLKKNNRYQVRVIPSEEARLALRNLQLLAPLEEGKLQLLKKVCCRKAFLRGIFLAGGSVNKPLSDYHLELVSDNEEMAQLILHIMQRFSLSAKMIDRKKDYIVYIKEGNAVTGFLSIIGAYNSLLEFENIRIVKEMRNNVNRIVNCETANLNKVVHAAVKQIACIKYISETKGLHELPILLKEAADLRLAHQEVPVGELAAMCEKPVSKSGFNHRLKRLEKIAEGMGFEEIGKEK